MWKFVSAILTTARNATAASLALMIFGRPWSRIFETRESERSLTPDSNESAPCSYRISTAHLKFLSIPAVGLCNNPIDKREHLYLYKVDSNGEIVGDEPIDKYNHAWEAFGRGCYFNFGPVGDVSKVSGAGRKYRVSFYSRNKRKKVTTRDNARYS